eukprot:Sspe_Gene.45667::Locus_22654_Transcript_1_1_Confidence_1.000_Length_1894::g.45667::m.45667
MPQMGCGASSEAKAEEEVAKQCTPKSAERPPRSRKCTINTEASAESVDDLQNAVIRGLENVTTLLAKAMEQVDSGDIFVDNVMQHLNELQLLLPGSLQNSAIEDKSHRKYKSRRKHTTRTRKAVKTTSPPVEHITGSASELLMPADVKSEGSSVSRTSSFSQALSDIVNVKHGSAVDMHAPAAGTLEELLLTSAEVANMATDDLDAMAVGVARRVRWLLKAEGVVIWIKQDDALAAVVDPITNFTSDIEGGSFVRVNRAISKLSPVEQNVLNSGTPFHSRDSDECITHNGVEVREALIQPISSSSTLLGLCMCINKNRMYDIDFSEDDSNMLTALLLFFSVCINNTLLFNKVRLERDNTAALLRMTTTLSDCSLDPEKLCNAIIVAAQELLGSDRCALFLVDRPRAELVAQLDNHEVRMPINKGIAGHVATTGEISNIPDAYADSRFNKELDEKTGYKTSTILCAPIKHNNDVVAVAQLVNKKTGMPFTKDDEKMFSSFSVFCGINLTNMMAHEALKNEKRTTQAMLHTCSELQKLDIMQIDEICQSIMTNARGLVGCERCWLLMVDKERGVLLRVDPSRPIEERRSVSLRCTIPGHVAMTGHTINTTEHV